MVQKALPGWAESLASCNIVSKKNPPGVPKKLGTPAARTRHPDQGLSAAASQKSGRCSLARRNGPAAAGHAVGRGHGRGGSGVLLQRDKS